MPHIKFNYVDNYSQKLVDIIEKEQTGHWAFKLVYTNRGNKLIGFINSMASAAKSIAVKYGCRLYDGCQSPIGAGWKYDKEGNIISEGDSAVLILYIFHGEKSFEAAEALNNVYRSLNIAL